MPVWGALLIAALAGLAACYLVAILIEKLSEPPHWPDTQDDPRAIDILKRGQVCPWPTDGECRDRTELAGGLAEQRHGPGGTETGHVRTHVERGFSA
jgi:hypothetical protein